MSVLHVFQMRSPLQIFRNIVAGITVDMVNGGAGFIRRGADKGEGNQPVNTPFTGSLVFGQIDVPVFASGLGEGGENAILGSFAAAYSGMQASHAAKIRDFVKIFVTGNGFPDFRHDSLLHRLLCLDGGAFRRSVVASYHVNKGFQAAFPCWCRFIVSVRGDEAAFLVSVLEDHSFPV